MGIGVIAIDFDILYGIGIAKDINKFTDFCTTCHPEILDTIGKAIRLPEGFGIAFVTRSEYSYGFHALIASQSIPACNPGETYPTLTVKQRADLHPAGNDKFHRVIVIESIAMPDGTVIYDRSTVA